MNTKHVYTNVTLVF